LLLTQDKALANITNRRGQKPIDLAKGGDALKLLNGEIEDVQYYSSSIFASLDKDDWGQLLTLHQVEEESDEEDDESSSDEEMNGES